MKEKEKKARKRNDDSARNNGLIGQTSDHGIKLMRPVPLFSGYTELTWPDGVKEEAKYQHVMTMACVYNQAKMAIEILYVAGYANLRRELSEHEGKPVVGGMDSLEPTPFRFRDIEEGGESIPMVVEFSNFYNRRREFIYRRINTKTIIKENGNYLVERDEKVYRNGQKIGVKTPVCMSTSGWAITSLNSFLGEECYVLTEDAVISPPKEKKVKAKKGEKEETVVIAKNRPIYDAATIRAINGALKEAGYDIHVVADEKAMKLNVVKNAKATGVPDAGCVTNLGDVFPKIS